MRIAFFGVALALAPSLATADTCGYPPCVPVSTSSSTVQQLLAAGSARGANATASSAAVAAASSSHTVASGTQCCCLANSFVSCAASDSGDGVVVDFSINNGAALALRSRHGATFQSQRLNLSPTNPTAYVSGTGFSGTLRYTRFTTMRNKIQHTVYTQLRSTRGALWRSPPVPAAISGAVPAGDGAENAGVGAGVPCEINSLSTSIGGASAPTFPDADCRRVCSPFDPKPCSAFSLCFVVPDPGLPEVWVGLKMGTSIYEFTLLSAFHKSPEMDVSFANCDGNGGTAFAAGFRIQIDPETDWYSASVTGGTFTLKDGSDWRTYGGPFYTWPKDGSEHGHVVDRD
jgi:hypothetical protein